MPAIFTRSSHWRRVSAVVLLVGMLLSAALAQQVTAGMRACRADPIVWLSNGAKVTMKARIAADASQVKLITYTVHAPRGLSLTHIVYTGGALKGKERVIMLFDRTSGYTIEVVANTGATVTPVTIVTAVGNTRRMLTMPSNTKIVFSFP
jgi:hypothetical protein